MASKTYRCIGIMTGNSLDAVDVVLSEFNGTHITDICGLSRDIPSSLSERFRRFKKIMAQTDCDIASYAAQKENNFRSLHDDYIHLVAQTVNRLLTENSINPQSVDAIGFHGQTCGHRPPSIAQSKDPKQIYTLQIGSGQMLADLTGIPVVYDFRSDDIMNLGEGAPLAPIHNQHIAQDLISKQIFPVAFLNAGNTGNLALISQNINTDKNIVMGWDTGPFNHFVDTLMQNEKNLPCDFNGQTGKSGKINYALLHKLFERSVITNSHKNFITMLPPKSSDPAWYVLIPELRDKSISLEDRVRTTEFFSAYIMAYNFSFIPQDVKKPQYFLLFGGGWKNPVILEDFTALIHGNAKVLPIHQKIFSDIANPKAIIKWSDEYGYNGKYMEARIFADMAKCFLTKEPFSYPETTGCIRPTVGGIMALPHGQDNRLWSRAAPGWATEQNTQQILSPANSKSR